MLRLLLIVEGLTEQVFVDNVLAPHVMQYGVVVPKARLVPTGKLGRGGVVNYAHVKRALAGWMGQERGSDVVFSTMFDLYKLPRNFPGYDEAKARSQPYSVIETLEKAFAEDIGDERFVPYLQLYEFEALLFSDPRAFSVRFANRHDEVTQLAKILEKFGNPEAIDDGESTAPSKRIINLIPEYREVKRSAGADVAQEIGIDKIRKACKHFDGWLTKLESLGKKAETL